MELKHKVILELTNAHLQLDGTKDSTYKFSANVRYSFAKNLRLLKGRSEDIDKARVSLVRAISPEKSIEPKTQEHDAFTEQYLAFLDDTDDIPNIMQIKLSDLNLEQNQIPISVLCSLSPLIVEEDAKP